MNRSFIVAVLTVTMIIMMSTAGYANTGEHDLTCDSCHGKFAGAGTNLNLLPGAPAANNSCITCHSTSGEASRMPINTGSMANYFNTVPGQPSTGSRSSHTFLISTTIYRTMSPNANTLEPVSPTATNGFTATSNNGLSPHSASTVNLQKQILCVRCHYAASNVNTGDLKPYLRSSNLNDALCLDCHRNRIPPDTTTYIGSHPVALRSYSSVYKSNTTAFRKRPLSANVNNPTALLGNYLTKNAAGTDRIVCSTCHAVHYGDSNSSTFDNKSSANGFNQDDPAKGLKGQLQNSKGQLLRTDPIGATASAINICSSCHKETANLNHNGAGQNIQCNHCHSAHVDYTGDGTLKNLDLVRRDFSNMSVSQSKGKFGSNVKVLFNNNTGFKRVDGKGICQVCHDLPLTVDAHSNANATNADCRGCHNHKNGFSPSSCSTCHGQPPMTSLVGGPNGKASASYTIDESLTPHATHADSAYYKYACKNCHYDGTKSGYHNTGSSFTDVFIDPAIIAGKPKNVPGDYAAKKCSNVYCHSNGDPLSNINPVLNIAYRTYTTPSWENGRNKILGTASECTTCHQSGSTLQTNAHSKHVTTYSMKCNVCHAATVSSSSAIADRTKHANGVKDVKFLTRPATFYGVFSSSWNSGNATCNNSCHTNGLGGAPAEQPVWTNSATGDCGSCHAAVATTSLHPFHFTGSTGPKLGADPDCSSCHVYSAGAITHANGEINLKPGNSCSPCHPGTTQIWATGAKVTCESCHTGTASIVGAYTASLKDLNATVGHGQYSTVTLNAKKCTNCHDATKNHIGAGPTEKRLLGFTASNDLCASCHTTVAAKGLPEARIDLPVHGGNVNKFSKYTSATNVANINGVRASECSGCHDTHGTTNRMSIRTIINGQQVAAYTGATPVFVVTSAPYNGLCQVCHTKTKYYNNGVPYVAHNLTTNCLSCHKHKGEGVTYAFQPIGGECGSCHGYPPVKDMAGLGTLGNYSHAKLQDYSGGGGAHTVSGHIPRTALQSEAWNNCSNCHISTSHMTGGTTVVPENVNVVVDPKFRFNNMSAIKYSNSTCSNVSCHFKPSPNWTNGL